MFCYIPAPHCLVTVYVILSCIRLGTNESRFPCDATYWCLIYILYFILVIVCSVDRTYVFIDMFHIEHTTFIWINESKNLLIIITIIIIITEY